MTEKNIARQHHTTFESIRQKDESGNEFWSACELAPLLEYQDWRNFLQVVDKARQACEQSGHRVDDHFGDVTKMVEIDSGVRRPVTDVRLSRYACYLIVQNGDPAKPVIANGQTYFAIQTRRQELADSSRFAQLSEDDKRLAIRNELTVHNRQLAAAAKGAGVETTLDYGTLVLCRLGLTRQPTKFSNEEHAMPTPPAPHAILRRYGLKKEGGIV